MISHRGAVVARQPHKLKVDGSIPSGAPIYETPQKDANHEKPGGGCQEGARDKIPVLS